MDGIHPTAIVHPAARIGSGVQIGPFSIVEEDVTIGDGCVIGPRVSVMRYTTLGANCRVHANAVLGDLPQDTGFGGGVSHVQIGNRCTIREGVTVHRGTKPDTVTVIGDDCFLMAYSHFAHNVQLGKRVIVANNALLAGYVEVGDGAFVSGNTSLHQFCRVGRLAMIGGGSAISVDVLPFTTTRSGTYNVLAGLNVIGLRRAGFSPAERSAVKQAFNVLFRSGLNRAEAVARIRADVPAGPAQELADFTSVSKRGICAPAALAAGGADGDEA